MTEIQTPDLMLILILGIACYTDLDRGRIPNGLTASLVLAGVIYNGLEGEPLVGLLGLAVGFAVHFGLWVLQVVKGGDAKLMMGVGALVGWQGLLEATLWEFVLFLPVGFVMLVLRGNLRSFYLHLQWLAMRARGTDIPAPPAVTYVVFAPIIASAVFAARMTDWFDLVAFFD